MGKKIPNYVSNKDIVRRKRREEKKKRMEGGVL